MVFSKIVSLSHHNFKKTFTVDTDASNYGIWGVVFQNSEQNRELSVAYFSRTFSKQERKYAVKRKEMLAVVELLTHFWFYLLIRRFFVCTDQSALQWLRNFKKPVVQMARWLQRLAEYDFKIEHRAGKNHANTDGVERILSTLAIVTEDKQWITPSLKTKISNHQKNNVLTLLFVKWLIKIKLPNNDKIEGTVR